MTKKTLRHTTITVTCALFTLLVILSSGFRTFGQCATNDIEIGWKKSPNSTPRQVGYTILTENGLGFTAFEKAQIHDGMSKWTIASKSTCIPVDFVEFGGGFPLWFHPQNIAPGRTRATTVIDPADFTVIEADIYIDFHDATRGAPGYDTIIHKMTLHEVGHTFGMDDADHPQTPQATVMNNPEFGINDATNNVPTNIMPCDIGTINMNDQCQIGYTRPSSIGPGTFPVSWNQQTGAMTTVTHAMSISNYNAANGSFTLRLTDYTTNRQNYQGPVTNSSASPDPYVVVKNTDACFNANGSVKDLTFTNGPVFGCPFTQHINLTQTGTENYAPPNGGNSGPFTKVYTGTTTPNSGIPYMHFIHSNPTAYAHNAPNP